MRRTKGAFRSRDRGIRCVREGGGRRRRGKMRDTKKRKKKMMEAAFVPVECWLCLESRCTSGEKNISL